MEQPEDHLRLLMVELRSAVPDRYLRSLVLRTDLTGLECKRFATILRDCATKRGVEATSEDSSRCWFCLKQSGEYAVLVKGANGNICDECVNVAQRAVKARGWRRFFMPVRSAATTVQDRAVIAFTSLVKATIAQVDAVRYLDGLFASVGASSIEAHFASEAMQNAIVETRPVGPFNADSDARCSFCSTKRAFRKLLVASPNATICDRCISIARKVVRRSIERPKHLV